MTVIYVQLPHALHLLAHPTVLCIRLVKLVIISLCKGVVMHT